MSFYINKFFICLLFSSSFLIASNDPNCINLSILASYPRSGSHWVRFLVHEATRDLTPRVFVNHIYDNREFKSEKHFQLYTQYHWPITKIRYDDRIDLIVRLVRNPVDHIYAHSSHDKRATKLMKRNLLVKYGDALIRFHDYWDRYDGRILTLKYEDFLKHPSLSLRRVLNAMNCQVSDEDVQRAVDKYPPKGKPYKHIVNYTFEDIEFLKERYHNLIDKYNYVIPAV